MAILVPTGQKLPVMAATNREAWARKTDCRGCCSPLPVDDIRGLPFGALTSPVSWRGGVFRFTGLVYLPGFGHVKRARARGYGPPGS